jgi:excisionase family DNA binding protein
MRNLAALLPLLLLIACGPPSEAEDCTDNTDNDGNGAIDCAELADLLRVNRKTVYDAAKRGLIPGVRKVGRNTIRFHRDTVIEWLAGQGTPPRR